jgi:hypothetical protein
MGRILAFMTSEGEGAETPEKEEDNQKVHDCGSDEWRRNKKKTSGD